MAVGQFYFGLLGKRLAQSTLVDEFLERFPLERLCSKRPLVTVTDQVLEMGEARDAMEALGVSRSWVAVQIEKQQEVMLDRFPREFRGAMVAWLVATAACLGVLILLFLSGILLPGSTYSYSYPHPHLSSDFYDILYYWQTGKLSLSEIPREMLYLLREPLSPRYGWLYFLLGACFLGPPGWLAWWFVSIAVRAHRQWQDKLREAVLLQVRTVLNAKAQQRGVTVLLVDRAPGLHGHGEPTHLVPSPEMARVRVLTEDLGAGVVAISGDRGIGKTTLLRALADPRYREPGSTELRLMLAAPVDYDAREFLVHLYLLLCELVRRIERPRGLFLLATESRWRRLRRILTILLLFFFFFVIVGIEVLIEPELAGLLIEFAMFLFPFFVLLATVILVLPTPSSPDGTKSEAGIPIERLAHRRLHQLRFQQTVGLERAGGFKPSWFELSRRTSRQLADRPMTLPELVESYRAFTERVVKWWRVRNMGRGSMVVGIDEVDRIADAAQAERFLNEVKAIFGVPHCTYLVSVSEEALASFERRVVRVRTVLDSAFDEVLRIDLLDLDRALELLGRRVMGVPAPFLALCHCLSGGVARDLIRVARVMFDARRKTGPTNLSELTVEMVDREVQTLKRGFTTRVVNLAAGSAADELLDLLAEPGWPGRNAAQILAAVRADLLSAKHDTADVAQARTELASALSFYATVLELFTDRAEVVIEAVAPDPQKVTSLEGEIVWLRADETVEALARARGALSVSPGLARRRLDRVRSRLGLSVLADPTGQPDPGSFGPQND